MRQGLGWSLRAVPEGPLHTEHTHGPWISCKSHVGIDTEVGAFTVTCSVPKMSNLGRLKQHFGVLGDCMSTQGQPQAATVPGTSDRPRVHSLSSSSEVLG